MSVGRQISRDEAVLIISRWRDAGAIIKSHCEVSPLGFSFRGRIVEFSDSQRVRISSIDDRASEFVFDVMEEFDCWYLAPRDVPQEAATSVCALTFFFLSRPGYESSKDFINLTELV